MCSSDLVPEGVVRTESGWRYSEWASGGFLEELGVDDEPIDPSLIPRPPEPGEAQSTEDRLKGFLERLFGRCCLKPTGPGCGP